MPRISGNSYDDMSYRVSGSGGDGSGSLSPFTFLCVVLIIAFFGLIILYSASFQKAIDNSLPHYYYFIRQLVSAGCALAAGLLEALDCGATLCDVMGDMYSPDPLELTKNPSAVSKQKELICEIHRRGGEVIMSSHVKRHLCQNDVIDFALSQEARGVDIVKLVTVADTMEQLMENLNASLLLQKRLSIPFIFVANGQYGKIQRNIGYMFGSFALLCVYRYRTPRIFSQPLIKSMKSVLQNVDWKPDRILKEAIGGLQ